MSSPTHPEPARRTEPTVPGRRIPVGALLYARIGEEVELVRYRLGRDGFVPELVRGVLADCTATTWVLMVDGAETSYAFTDWEYCIGAEHDECAPTRIPKRKTGGRRQAPRSITVGRLRAPCPAVRTQYLNDPAVTDVQLLSPSSRTGKRTCSACGARGVAMLQTLRQGVPIQAWQYTRHYPPVSRRSDGDT